MVLKGSKGRLGPRQGLGTHSRDDTVLGDDVLNVLGPGVLEGPPHTLQPHEGPLLSAEPVDLCRVDRTMVSEEANEEKPTYLWSMKTNLPSLVCLEMKSMDCGGTVRPNLAASCAPEARSGWCTLPTATCRPQHTWVLGGRPGLEVASKVDHTVLLIWKTHSRAQCVHDKPQCGPLRREGDFATNINSAPAGPCQCWLAPANASPELCDLDFFLGQPVEESASSFSTGADLHLMRQKNARREPGHSLVRPCGTSVFTGSSAGDTCI
ncbi:hypothetical protein E2C01_021217 [Portunus trituberculatus]|uniref:Uncharacterized protein n=1 Tax=Portunus trituberculatus TaxID=210409 RepID=A0A5B7E5H7_PORTR|nr:hypothetical protein [Portunus trituberculatus]